MTQDAKDKQEKFKRKVRAGGYSINSKRVKGHKGEISKVRKDGNFVTTIFTHSPYTRGKKNIKLKENPEKGRRIPMLSQSQRLSK